jgi:purine-binding chemotaxis protein CheW
MSETPRDERPATGDGTGIDWDQINKRLKRLRGLVDDKGPNASARHKILRERAAALSHALEDDEPVGDLLELLEFELAGERYAIDSDAVKEVYALKEITPVPGTPAFILGVVSVRGRVVSVIDLGRLFEGEARSGETFKFALVLQSPKMEFAVLADEVAGICRLRSSELQTSLPTLTGTRRKYFRGVTPDRVTVLDAQRLLGDDSLVVRQERGAAR